MGVRQFPALSPRKLLGYMLDAGNQLASPRKGIIWGLIIQFSAPPRKLLGYILDAENQFTSPRKEKKRENAESKKSAYFSASKDFLPAVKQADS